jgi:hypothetical protein
MKRLAPGASEINVISATLFKTVLLTGAWIIPHLDIQTERDYRVFFSMKKQAYPIYILLSGAYGWQTVLFYVKRK